MSGLQGSVRSFRGLRAVATTAVLALAVLAPAARPVAASPSPENPAKLILAGWYGNTTPTPSYIAGNLSFLESQPFDGLVVYLRNASMSVNLSTGVMKSTAISYDAMMSVLSPIASLSFTHLTDNLGFVLGSTPPDFFDDWSAVVQNWANLARALKDSGLKGVCFDNEQYSAPWGDYGSHNKYYTSKTKAEYETQARLRGKQVMEAMVAEFPNIVMITLHGPYISEPDAPTALEFPQWQSGNELMGPFFAGNLEGAGTTATCIDGGELYSLRSELSFQASADWRRTTLPSDEVNSSFIPAALRTVWPSRTNISFGVYDTAFWGNAMNPTVLRPTLANAMRQADKYVWFYPEAYTYLKPASNGGAPTTWVDAIRGAREDVAAAPAPSPSPDPDPAPAAGPNAPTALAASAMNPFEVDLTWTDNSTDESGFQVERKVGAAGAWSLVATTQAGATYIRDGGLWSATTYVYRIRAVNASGSSAYTAEASVTTPLVGDFMPAAPTNLNAVGISTSEIDLSWTDNSTTESGFQVERKTLAGSWALLTTCQAGATSHRDASLAPGTAYVYRVRAVNIVGESAYTAEATGTTASLAVPPTAPSNLTATAVSPFDIDLTWTDNSSDESGFEIERKTAINGTWALVATTQAGVTAFRSGGLWSATAYVYRVRAVSSAGASALSNEATATTPFVVQAAPAAPTGVTAIAWLPTVAEVRWTDNSSNENGFRIERRRSGGTWGFVTNVPAGTTSYQDAGRTRGITYIYRIRAFNAVGNSSYSNQARVTMP